MDDEFSYKQATDDELASMLASGQTEALGEILVRFERPVTYRLKRAFGSSLGDSDLEDVLATALLKLWQSRLRLSKSTEHHLQQWFYLIARNTAIDLVRKRAREQAWHRMLHGDQLREPRRPTLTHYDNSASTPPHSNQFSLLQELIQELPARDQVILDGYIFAASDYPWAGDVAKELGMTENAVRVRLSRILTRLRERAQLLPSTKP